jgi:hypothetical protein
MTVKQDLMDNTKIIFVVKVIRELVKEAIGVLSHQDFGAIEIGLHEFHNNAGQKGMFSHSINLSFWKKISGSLQRNGLFATRLCNTQKTTFIRWF